MRFYSFKNLYKNVYVFRENYLRMDYRTMIIVLSKYKTFPYQDKLIKMMIDEDEKFVCGNLIIESLKYQYKYHLPIVGFVHLIFMVYEKIKYSFKYGNKSKYDSKKILIEEFLIFSKKLIHEYIVKHAKYNDKFKELITISVSFYSNFYGSYNFDKNTFVDYHEHLLLNILNNANNEINKRTEFNNKNMGYNEFIKLCSIIIFKHFKENIRDMIEYYYDRVDILINKNYKSERYNSRNKQVHETYVKKENDARNNHNNLINTFVNDNVNSTFIELLRNYLKFITDLDIDVLEILKSLPNISNVNPPQFYTCLCNEVKKIEMYYFGRTFLKVFMEIMCCNTNVINISAYNIVNEFDNIAFFNCGTNNDIFYIKNYKVNNNSKIQKYSRNETYDLIYEEICNNSLFDETCNFHETVKYMNIMEKNIFRNFYKFSKLPTILKSINLFYEKAYEIFKVEFIKNTKKSVLNLMENTIYSFSLYGKKNISSFCFMYNIGLKVYLYDKILYFYENLSDSDKTRLANVYTNELCSFKSKYNIKYFKHFPILQFFENLYKFIMTNDIDKNITKDDIIIRGVKYISDIDPDLKVNKDHTYKNMKSIKKENLSKTFAFGFDLDASYKHIITPIIVNNIQSNIIDKFDKF